MGTVYLATDARSGRAVALKVLRDDVSADPVYRERFRREARILAGLRHPHVMPIYATEEVDGELIIAARLVCGTLADVLRAGRLEVRSALRILAAVAGAIDAAHVAGIVHRDIKPANVLVDPGPRVYLGDFGLARSERDERLTLPGQIFGTLDYMAPELLDGEADGSRADIYAFACLCVETLTGMVPYSRPTDAAVMYAHLVDEPPSVSARRPELPERLDAVVAEGMAKDPDDRPGSAGALVADMLRAVGEPMPARLAAAS